VIDDETALLWSTLAFLAPFALLTTRYGTTIGDICTGHRDELAGLVGETAAVSAACGAPVDVTKPLSLYESFPPSAKSSMQRDAEAGRPLELDAIGGALLRAAERHEVAVPVAAAIMAELATR
jgi:2-dehydropantoate 2-reductase